jgi:hypothetical protein
MEQIHIHPHCKKNFPATLSKYWTPHERMFRPRREYNYHLKMPTEMCLHHTQYMSFDQNLHYNYRVYK